MGTRTGDIDPAIVPFLMNKTGMNYDEVDAIMNKNPVYLVFPVCPMTSA